MTGKVEELLISERKKITITIRINRFRGISDRFCYKTSQKC